MDPLFICPPPSPLADIPAQACPENWGQIQRFAYQIIQDTPSFTSTTIKTASAWAALKTATDDTKIVVGPLTPGIAFPNGDVIVEGGNDNTTVNGVPKLVGRGFVGVTFIMQSLSKAVRDGLRGLTAQSAVTPGVTNIWMYMFNQYNQIIANEDGSGIPIYNVYLGDTGSGGFNKLNENNLRFDLAGGWSDDLEIFTPTGGFKPLNL